MSIMGRVINCKHCRQPFESERKGQKACSIECAQGIVQAEHEKAFRRETARRKKYLRESDYRYWEKRAKTACHAYIRTRDRGKKCKSCDKVLAGKFDAGHFYNSNGYPVLRYDDRNIHGQCSQCNSAKMKGGNLLEYRIGLIERYGEAFVKELEQDSRSASKRWTIPELKQIEQYYKDKLKEIKGGSNQKIQ